MSETFKDNPEVILLLLAGWAVMVVVFFILRRKGMEKYRYDERYYQVNNRIKAKSWDVMLIVLYIAWLVVIIFDGISFSFFLMTAIVVIRSLTQVIVGIYYSWDD